MQSLKGLYENLIDILEREFGLCSELVTLLQKEKDVIAGLNLEALETHLREKQLVSSKIDICENSRENILRSLGLTGKSLTEVASIADIDHRERLFQIASKFKAIASSISELNTLNNLLIERSLFHVRSSRNFLKTFGIDPQQRISVEA